MGITRHDDRHLAFMAHLAHVLGIDLLPARAAIGMAAHHLATARAIATRHAGDHAAYSELATQIRIALAYSNHDARHGFDRVRDTFVNLRETAQTYLRSLNHTQRVQLAAAQGFHHPHLTEENTRPGGDPALITWLNPVYDTSSDPLKRIQNAAEARYATRYPDLVEAFEDAADRYAKLAERSQRRTVIVEFRYGN